MTGKKLVIVATHTTETNGGISSSLAGYEEGLNQLDVEFIRVNSHSDIRGRISCWITAWWQVLLLAVRYRSRVIFWFHCGPWLSLTRKWSFAITARLFGCQTVAHMHSPTLHNYINNKYGQYLLKLFFAPFRRVIALTPWWKEQLVIFGINKPIYVCPNPVSEDILSAAKLTLSTPKILRDPQNDIVILSMARLIEGKGVEHVIDAMAILPEHYHLKIAGEGPLKPLLIQRIASLKLQNRVTCVGWVDGADKHNLFNSVDIFCLPSKYDSFGVVFIEAMAFDLPIIACDWGPITDVVTPEVGLLVPYCNPQGIADSVETLAKNYQHYYGKGPQRVMTNFSPLTCCKNVLNALHHQDD
jgi:glycosyltransferase involved in cell wall biosynthesis